MKINIIPKKGSGSFTVEAKPDNTVSDLRKLIGMAGGPNQFPSDKQRLVHSQRLILDDTANLSQIGIGEGDDIYITIDDQDQSANSAATTSATRVPPNRVTGVASDFELDLLDLLAIQRLEKYAIDSASAKATYLLFHKNEKKAADYLNPPSGPSTAPPPRRGFMQPGCCLKSVWEFCCFQERIDSEPECEATIFIRELFQRDRRNLWAFAMNYNLGQRPFNKPPATIGSILGIFSILLGIHVFGGTVGFVTNKKWLLRAEYTFFVAVLLSLALYFPPARARITLYIYIYIYIGVLKMLCLVLVVLFMGIMLVVGQH